MKYYYVEPNYFATSDLVFTDVASLNNFLNYTKYSCTVKVRQTKDYSHVKQDKEVKNDKTFI